MTGPKKEHAFLGFDGCVDAHRQRDGHLIAIFASVASGIESDPELPWSVSCEDHNTCVCTPTLDAARRCKTDDFCDDCRDKQPATAELSSLARSAIQGDRRDRQRETRTAQVAPEEAESDRQIKGGWTCCWAMTTTLRTSAP